jgi:hypothetical protein
MFTEIGIPVRIISEPARGLSEWAKQLLTIGTGVLLGTFLPLFLKAVTDAQKRRVIRRTVVAELDRLAWSLGEITNEYGRARSQSITEGSEATESQLMPSPDIDKLKSKLFDHYTDKEPEALYQIRNLEDISRAYDLLKEFRECHTEVKMNKAQEEFNFLAKKKITKTIV